MSWWAEKVGGNGGCQGSEERHRSKGGVGGWNE